MAKLAGKVVRLKAKFCADVSFEGTIVSSLPDINDVASICLFSFKATCGKLF